LIAILYRTNIFLTSHLGVNIPGMGLQKDGLGRMIITSVGFGYIKADTSFFGSTRQWIKLTVNAVHEKAIVVESKVKFAKIVNAN